MTSDVMKEAAKDLSEVQIEFILTECQMTREEFDALTEDELYDNVYDVMCDIELEETPDDGGEESERCKMAVSIVTLLGNVLAVDDFEEEETA